MQSATQGKRVFTEQETSLYIGMSRSFLRQSCMEGLRKNRTKAPPFIKIGRAVQDLDPWLDSHRKMHQLRHEGAAYV